MFYIVLWIFVSPPDVNDSKIIREDYFLVLNCGCGYAAKFDIAVKYNNRRGHGCGYNAAAETSKAYLILLCSNRNCRGFNKEPFFLS